MRSFWSGLGRGARAGLVAGVVAILAATVACGYWLMRTDYQVLFTDLSPQDASAMANELDRMKMQYILADNGTSILVDKHAVYRTRLKLMGGDLPLHGAVGFELFNNSDFGMTEFAQKINYQRALQGELTRTILSLDEIRDARVLLALPEQGLFKQAESKAKASITLTLKPGASLRAEQVAGIQRLVSAAVPGIDAQAVTIVDQTGIALTRPAGGAGDSFDAGASGLDMKKDTEAYLSRKAQTVLDRALGAGQALASVDVVLDMQRVQATTEDVVPAPTARADERATGVVVHERNTQRESGAPLDSATTQAGSDRQSGSTQREVDYAVGRRVEQVASQPGAIRRIQVAVVVRRALDQNQQAQVRRMIAASVGASAERGDAIVVQTLDALNAPAAAYGIAPPVAAGPQSDTASAASASSPPSAPARVPLDKAGGRSPWSPSIGVIAALAMLVALVALARSIIRGMRGEASHGGDERRAVRALSDAEREAALARLQAWLRGESTPSEPRSTP